MSWISWLEARLGFLGIPRLMQMIAVLNGLVYLLHFFQPAYVNTLLFSSERILHGEVWRLVSYIFVPSIAMGASAIQVLFLIMYLWFMIWMGDALEHAWGAFRLTLFYVLGMVGMTIGAFFFGGSASSFLLNLSLFFAFATLYPEMQIYVMYILPMKVKWVAMFSAALLLLQLLVVPISGKIAIVASFINYIIFFGPSVVDQMRHRAGTERRRRKFEVKSVGAGESLHQCKICKRTEKDSHDLEFRVAADGEEYCLEHLPKAPAGNTR